MTLLLPDRLQSVWNALHFWGPTRAAKDQAAQQAHDLMASLPRRHTPTPEDKAVIDRAIADAKRDAPLLFHGPPRDPERIDKVLDLVGQVWKNDSDQRLLQLLGNLAWVGYEHEGGIFGIEDDVLYERLQTALAIPAENHATLKVWTS